MGLKVLGGRRDVGSDPYTLKPFRLTVRMIGIDHFYVGRRHGFGCKKARRIGRILPRNGRPFTHYLGKGDHDEGLTATPTPYLA
jgi:hypothetical protein